MSPSSRNLAPTVWFSLAIAVAGTAGGARADERVTLSPGESVEITSSRKIVCIAASETKTTCWAEGNSPSPINGSGSTSQSCSATIKVCDVNGANCRSGYAYAYTYQYASVSSGRLSSESHSLSFSGLLGDDDDYTVLGAAGYWVLHRGPEFVVAAPWKSGSGIWVSKSGGGMPGESGWTKVCD